MPDNHIEPLNEGQDTQPVLIKNTEVTVPKNRRFSGLFSSVIIIFIILISLFLIYHFQNNVADTCVQGEECVVLTQDLREIPKISSDHIAASDHNRVTLPNSDPDTFINFFSGYSKDKNNVYYYENIVVGVDPETFTYNSARDYFGDQNFVMYEDEILENADVSTYQRFSHGNFSKDKNNVYYLGEVFIKADAKSFKVLVPSYGHNRGIFAYDKNYYFKNNEIIGQTNSPDIRIFDDRYLLINNRLLWTAGGERENVISYPKSLVYLGADFFKDDVNVYSMHTEPVGVLEKIKPNDFDIYLPTGSRVYISEEGQRFSHYVRTENVITLRTIGVAGSDDIIESVDVKTFELMDWPYAKDRNSVYYYHNKIEGVDLATFTLIGEEGLYSKDNSNVYYRTKIIQSARSNKFVTIKVNIDTHLVIIGIDDKSVYYESLKLEGLNPSELRIERDGAILRDSDTAYYLQIICGTKFSEIKYVPESEIRDPENYVFECYDNPVIRPPFAG